MKKFFLTYSGEKTEIPEPVKFDAFTIKLKRSENHGTMWEFGENKIDFYDNGISGTMDGIGNPYRIIKAAYDSDGVDADVTFIMEENGETLQWKILYSTFEDVEEEYTYFSVNVGEISVQTTLRNRMDTKVCLNATKGFDGADLPNYNNLGKSIMLPGKAVKIMSKSSSSGYEFASTQRFISFAFEDTIHSELGEINMQNSVSDNSASLQPLLTIPDGLSFTSTYIEYEFSIFVSVTLPFPSPSGSFATASIYIQKNNEQPELLFSMRSDDLINSQSIGMSSGIVSGNMPHTINSGDEIRLYCEIYSNRYITRCLFGLHSDSFFHISTNSILAPTPAKVNLIHETLSRIVEAATNNQMTVKSDYYGRTNSNVNPTTIDGCGALRCITNGFFVRNATMTDGSEPFVFVSLTEMLYGLNAIDCIGWGMMDGFLRIEPYKFFYNNEEVLYCKNVAEIMRSFDNDTCYQRFSGGYEKWEAEEWNGIDGFHGKRQYRNRLKAVDLELKQECKFIADSYAIEATRRRQIDAETKDWRYDNNIFIIELKQVDDDFVVKTGVSDVNNTLIDPDTVYNAGISPARNAMRWFGRFMQGAKYAVDKMIFASSEGYSNAQMNTVNNCSPENATLVENQDIDAGMFADADIAVSIFNPEIIEFDYPTTMEDYRKLKANPRGLIRFSSGGVQGYGWIKTVELNLFDGMAKYTLIAKK